MTSLRLHSKFLLGTFLLCGWLLLAVCPSAVESVHFDKVPRQKRSRRSRKPSLPSVAELPVALLASHPTILDSRSLLSLAQTSRSNQRDVYHAVPTLDATNPHRQQLVAACGDAFASSVLSRRHLGTHPYYFWNLERLSDAQCVEALAHFCRMDAVPSAKQRHPLQFRAIQWDPRLLEWLHVTSYRLQDCKAEFSIRLDAVPALEWDTVLKVLAFPSLRLIQIHNSVNEETVEPLARALGQNTGLHTLDLSFNDIDDEGVAVLANTLLHHPALEELDLSVNRIGMEGACALAAMLEKRTLPPLQELDLFDNDVCAEGARRLIMAMEKKAREAPGDVRPYLNLSYNDIRLRKIRNLVIQDDLQIFVNWNGNIPY